MVADVTTLIGGTASLPNSRIKVVPFLSVLIEKALNPGETTISA
jgi:hypothetical protein